MSDNLIEIRDLNVAFSGQTVVRNLCLDIRPGECLALVGESGCGKSVTAHSILQLLPETGTETTGSIRYRSQELIGADVKILRELRGNRIAMIFQEPMTSSTRCTALKSRSAKPCCCIRGWAAKRRKRGFSSCCNWWVSRNPKSGSRPIPINCPAASDNG